MAPGSVPHRHRGTRVTAARELTLSVIVPAYNEAPTIETVVRRLRDVQLPLEILAVDDASTDQTGAVLDRLAREGLVHQVIHHPTKRRKGAALRSRFAAGTAQVVVAQDAALEYDPGALSTFPAPMRHARADAVYG